jgi:hypothetical protein
MTHEEARKVARVIIGADSGCSVCVGELARDMEAAFPGEPWVALVAHEDWPAEHPDPEWPE